MELVGLRRLGRRVRGSSCRVDGESSPLCGTPGRFGRLLPAAPQTNWEFVLETCTIMGGLLVLLSHVQTSHHEARRGVPYCASVPPCASLPPCAGVPVQRRGTAAPQHRRTAATRRR